VTARSFTWPARFGFSWTTRSVPIGPILLLGAALGPAGLAVLTPAVLSVIDPALPIAVATLGVLAGLELTGPSALRYWKVPAKANLLSLAAGALITVGFWWIAPALGVDGAMAWLVALIVGISGATSASLPAVDEEDPRPTTVVIRDLDVLLPALVGLVVLASLHGSSVVASAFMAAQALGLGLAISGVAWLLLTSGSQGAEQRVFAIAILLVLGGVADYLSLSALGLGLVTGISCGVIGGATRDAIERDASYLRQPLVVLMLLSAGAQFTLDWPIATAAAAYILLRTTGKLLGGPYLLAPGVLGLAFAVDAAPMFGPFEPLILSTVVLGTIGSQLVAGFWQSRGPSS